MCHVRQLGDGLPGVISQVVLTGSVPLPLFAGVLHIAIDPCQMWYFHLCCACIVPHLQYRTVLVRGLVVYLDRIVSRSEIFTMFAIDLVPQLLNSPKVCIYMYRCRCYHASAKVKYLLNRSTYRYCVIPPRFHCNYIG